MDSVVSLDPRDGSITEIVALASDAEAVDTACRSAAVAAADLQRLSLVQRAEMLVRLAAALDREAEELIQVADRETALGATRLAGELTRTTNQLRLFATVITDAACFDAVIDHADAQSTPPAPDLRRLLVPIGPVAVFGASNFPFAFSVAGGDTASAWAAGCPVVVKAHSSHPALSLQVTAVIRAELEQAGLNPDILAVVYGRDAGKMLVQHPLIQAVGFTGSETGGRTLMDLAANRPSPIPVYAEMGSLNPLIVSPGMADNIEELAAGISGSLLLGHGQFCTKPGLLFIPYGPAGDRLVEALSHAIAAASPAYMLSLGIRDAFVQNVAAIAELDGVTSLVGPSAMDQRSSSSTGALAEADARYVVEEPSVMTECFGPAALVVRYESLNDLLPAVSAVPPSLTLSIHVKHEEQAFAASLIELGLQGAGRLIINGFPTGVAVNWAQHHGGPYPASSSPMFSSVGASALRRFLKPVAFQGFPDAWLPMELQESNPLGITRRVDGKLHLGQSEV
ncbi:MAG: NADP-dependent aldehyde dehydrogenase [Actinomycetota bacterium]|jgi:NADP-dependent aldehyde dehydrogenase|nr:NADP-dependent aldehyde dehydrogenase [Actinomycetota bacterium]